jgi:hypothetical protein
VPLDDDIVVQHFVLRMRSVPARLRLKRFERERRVIPRQRDGSRVR